MPKNHPSILQFFNSSILQSPFVRTIDDATAVATSVGSTLVLTTSVIVRVNVRVNVPVPVIVVLD